MAKVAYVVITFNSYDGEQQFGSVRPTAVSNSRFRDTLLSQKGWSSCSDGTMERFTQLLVLDFLCSSAFMQHPSIYDYFSSTSPRVYGLSPHVNMVFSLPGLEEAHDLFHMPSGDDKDILMRLWHSEQVLHEVEDLIDGILFLLQTVTWKSSSNPQ